LSKNEDASAKFTIDLQSLNLPNHVLDKIKNALGETIENELAKIDELKGDFDITPIGHGTGGGPIGYIVEKN